MITSHAKLLLLDEIYLKKFSGNGSSFKGKDSALSKLNLVIDYFSSYPYYNFVCLNNKNVKINVGNDFSRYSIEDKIFTADSINKLNNGIGSIINDYVFECVNQRIGLTNDKVLISEIRQDLSVFFKKALALNYVKFAYDRVNYFFFSGEYAEILDSIDNIPKEKIFIDEDLKRCN